MKTRRDVFVKEKKKHIWIKKKKQCNEMTKANIWILILSSRCLWCRRTYLLRRRADELKQKFLLDQRKRQSASKYFKHFNASNKKYPVFY